MPRAVSPFSYHCRNYCIRPTLSELSVIVTIFFSVQYLTSLVKYKCQTVHYKTTASSTAPPTSNPIIMNTNTTYMDDMFPSAKSRTEKRKDYLSWDEYFMSIALLSAKRSKDPKTQIGACIVNPENRVVGIGYNGFPLGCSDEYLPWGNYANVSSISQQDSDYFLNTKQAYMCHAEMNAILNAITSDLKGCKMYVLIFPCNDAAKMIIQAGISEVVYLEDFEPKKRYIASQIMFEMANVKVTQFSCGDESRKQVTLKFPVGDEENKKYSCSNNETELKKEIDRENVRELLMKVSDFDIDSDLMKKDFQKKNSEYLSWDDYFLAIAYLSAQRSKDPSTQVGACIVNPEKRIVGIGYNGFPKGCSDDKLPWSRIALSSSSEKNCIPVSTPEKIHKERKLSSPKIDLDTKYPYVCHAEVNAILNKCSSNLKGATLYVALFPCNNCAKMIIQAGIREVVYFDDKYHNFDSCRASRILFAMAGVKTRYHSPSVQQITLNFMKQENPKLFDKL